MENKKYNLTIAPLWFTKNGKHMMSIAIGEEQFDGVQQIREGGKLFIKLNTNKKPGTNSPDGWVEYMTPEKVAEFSSQQKSSDTKASPPASEVF
jgi:hypothetical protein